MVDIMEANANGPDLDGKAGEDHGYRAPELRSAGSAVKMVQGVGEYNSYDQCGHASWGC